MPRFVPKANAAMKNATFARWPQNTASIHHIPFKSTSDFFHDDFFWCHRTASHPAASFKVQCWDGFGDEDQDSALSSSIIQCGLGSSLAFLILNGYIYIYVWIYTYTLISVITETLCIYETKTIQILGNMFAYASVIPWGRLYTWSWVCQECEEIREERPWHCRPVCKAKGQARRDRHRCFQW